MDAVSEREPHSGGFEPSMFGIASNNISYIIRRFHNGHNQMGSEQNAEDSGFQPENNGSG